MYDELPQMKVPIPGPISKKILEICKKYECTGLKTFLDKNPIVYKETKDALIEDADGNTFLDITGSFSAISIGHGNQNVVKAICSQAKKCIHAPSNNPTPIRAEFILQLMKIAPKSLNRVCFAVTGTEANEIAVKLSKSYTKKYEFITFYGCYFGRSLMALRLGSKRKFKNILPLGGEAYFMPYPYCYRCIFQLEYPKCGMLCLQYLKDALRNPVSGLGNIGAIFLEPIEGSGGIIIPPKNFLQELRNICNEYNILLILDEIQTGFGRTGKMWASDYENIVPDIMTIGKGIGGGLPVAAVLGKEGIMTSWKPGSHTTTFLTNAVLQSSSIATIKELLEKDYLKIISNKGIYFLNSLKKLENEFDFIGDVRGKGLLIGVEFVKSRKTKKPAMEETKLFVEQCLKEGILVQIGGWYDNVLRISPPYTITEKQIDYTINVFYEILKKMTS